MRKQEVQLRPCLQCGLFIPRRTTNVSNRCSPTQYATRKFCSLRCKGDWQRSAFKGDNNPHYKHGCSTWRELLHGSADYRHWRKTILLRDNFTCVNCDKRGGDLEVDHIKPLAVFPELALDLQNGRTLCLDCHELTPSFRNNKVTQLYAVQ